MPANKKATEEKISKTSKLKKKPKPMTAAVCKKEGGWVFPFLNA